MRGESRPREMRWQETSVRTEEVGQKAQEGWAGVVERQLEERWRYEPPEEKSRDVRVGYPVTSLSAGDGKGIVSIR
ncbi:hypothetical protein SARC_08077 [Sphaeroforma arctica JP610]|uniref:Uncharacterized protein n=1 Tax=Sphaeroforma arctica JP610 TaxID=667725 RepID=A0A0L0FUC8_9EUKA|nr:hypothetical protein SARC_08077 [Sphaeroforma arctica JP610]KNC79533.1 hypothetical protein SARC_08077 [Sphaeroforma arctica JP610]|eukprot:XP_014153435.1 hypothetical protein SARC_08077 [Sphaeroforma arctica JP610]